METASPPGFYLPSTDIRWDELVPAGGRSFCEWKGEARYWRLSSGAADDPVAWSYPDPTAPYEMLRGYVSFYPGRVVCRVEGERVQPQPGPFYGGWVTKAVVGPFKGEPGTEHW
jgi:uncharacterized protein (DUF427 family)